MNTFRDKIIFPTSAATYCSAFLANFPVCLFRHRWVLDPAWYLQKRTMSQLSRKFYLYLPSGLCRGWGRSYMFRWVWSQFCQMIYRPWWHHQMETFSALLAICAGNSPVNSPYKGQWRGALMFSLICAWKNGWVNNGEAGDLSRHRTRYDVTVMIIEYLWRKMLVITCNIFINLLSPWCRDMKTLSALLIIWWFYIITRNPTKWKHRV